MTGGELKPFETKNEQTQSYLMTNVASIYDYIIYEWSVLNEPNVIRIAYVYLYIYIFNFDKTLINTDRAIIKYYYLYYDSIIYLLRILRVFIYSLYLY